MPATLTQTVVGASQFTGLAGAGLFSFAEHDKLPRTTGVIIHSISYVERRAAVDLTTNVQFWARKLLSGSPTLQVPLGDATAAGGLLDVLGDARLKLCGHVLQRNPGDWKPLPSVDGLFWQVQCFTQAKLATGSITVTYDLCDFNETEERGSRDPS